MYESEIKLAVEVTSAIMCFILLWYMTKPYRLTHESRYIGLPLGFCFLGASYIVSSVAKVLPDYFPNSLSWLQLFLRAFSFVFLAVSYYFSKLPSNKSRIIWNLTISTLIVASAACILIVIVVPNFDVEGLHLASMYVRVFNVIFISYIAIHILRKQVKTLDPTTIWMPVGYILLGISQYLLLVNDMDKSPFAFWSALTLRLMALSVFLVISYLIFFSSLKGHINEETST